MALEVSPIRTVYMKGGMEVHCIHDQKANGDHKIAKHKYKIKKIKLDKDVTYVLVWTYCPFKRTFYIGHEQPKDPWGKL